MQEPSTQVRAVCLVARWSGGHLTVHKKLFLQTLMEQFGVLTAQDLMFFLIDQSGCEN